MKWFIKSYLSKKKFRIFFLNPLSCLFPEQRKKPFSFTWVCDLYSWTCNVFYPFHISNYFISLEIDSSILAYFCFVYKLPQICLLCYWQEIWYMIHLFLEMFLQCTQMVFTDPAWGVSYSRTGNLQCQRLVIGIVLFSEQKI